MFLWSAVVILGLMVAGAAAVAWRTHVHDQERRRIVEQCVPRSREEAEFFEQCWSAGRTRH